MTTGLKVLTQTTEEWRNQIRGEYPWIRLFGIRRPDGKWYRLARFTQQINYGKDSNGVSVPWYPYDVNFDQIDSDEESNLVEFKIIINNGAREVANALSQHDFTGQRVRFLMVHALELDVDGSAVIDQPGKISRVDYSRTATTINVSISNLYDYFLPSRIYSRSICGKLYGGPECLIDKTLPGMPQVCSRLLGACEDRGDVEVTNGLPRKHPLLFGAFPGTQNQ